MHDTLHALRYYVFIVLMQIINKLRECAVVFGRSDTFSVDATRVALPADSRLVPGRRCSQSALNRQGGETQLLLLFYAQAATSNHK